MKKIILSLLVLLTLSACSSANFDGPNALYGYLDYDKATLTYSNQNNNDILYQTGNLRDDFFILYESYYKKPLSKDEKTTYTLFFNKYKDIVLKLNSTNESILDFSSNEFNEAIQSENMDASLDDIVIFNQIKNMINQIKIDNYDTSIKTLTYIKKRLDMTLDEFDFSALELLNHYYQQSGTHLDNYFLTNNIDDFILLLNDLGINPESEDLPLLNRAYDIIFLLLKKN